jgi:hypothetical protein
MENGNQFFLTMPEGLLIDPKQCDDVFKEFLGLLAKNGVTPEEYQALREHSLVTKGKAAHLGGFEKAIAQLRFISPYIVLPSFPSSGVIQANTALEYNWQPDTDEVCLKRINDQFGGFSKKPLELDVVRHEIPNLQSWQSHFVVSTVDAILWLGIDPEEFLKDKPNAKAVERYCEFLRHLSKISNLKLGDYYQGCIKKDGALPHPDCIRAWQRLETKQASGGALTVRHMPVNPAAWFCTEEKPHSIAPMHTPGLVKDLPAGNRMKTAAVGDMITVATFLNMNPFILQQIAAGTCPRIDVAGTKLRGGGDWSRCPYVLQCDSGAWLGGYWANGADGRYGSFVCAWE